MSRNPYVILGIPFGASRAQANVAFARKARSLRRGGDTDQLTDLTWALQRIDEAIRQPGTAMELYRIPADPRAFQGGGEGVLQPPAERFGALEADRGQALAWTQQSAARELLRYLAPLRAKRVGVPPP